MVRKTLVALAALLSICSLAGTTGATAAAAQIVLTPTNVIGGTDAYNGNPGGGYWNSGSFPASNILSTQTGIVSEASYSGFWLNADSGAPSPYITINLGGSFDNLSQVEVFNTHNGGYNDRGTGQFEIVGGNTVTNVGTALAPNYELTGPTTVLFSGTLAAANSSQDATGIPGQTFSAIATGSFQYLAFEPLTVAAASNGGLGCCGPDNFGLNEIRVFTSPEPSSYAAAIGLCGMGLLGFAFRRRISRAAGAAAILLAALAGSLGWSSSSASAGTITTITSGDAGGGVTLNPARIVYADDIFGQQVNPNVVQGVTFTAGNPNIVDVQAYGGQANGGGDPPSGTFSNSDANSSALLNIVTSLIYGAQTVTIGGLTPNDPYNVQLLISDGSNDPRIQDISVNGSTPDVLAVAVNQAYDVSYNATANGSGNIIVTLVPDVNSGDPNPVLNGVVVQAVPEPSSIVALTGCGMLGLVALVVRRRKS